MQITSVDIYRMDLELQYQVSTSNGTTNSCKNIYIRINTDENIQGWGEISPNEYVLGESQNIAFEASKVYASLLIGHDPLEINENMALLERKLYSHNPTKSAFNIAMWDIMGKFANLPVYKLLGGKNRLLRTDITIGYEKSIESIQKLANKYKNQKFKEIKLKTGRPGDIDFLHVKAVRDVVGEDIQIKIDSNQGWNFASTVKNAKKMESLNISYIEQPLPSWNLRDMVELHRKIDIPFCLDESVCTDIDAFNICQMNAADILNIKLAKAGGISMGIKICSIAKSCGIDCMIGCFSESRLGLTAACHLALACPNIFYLDLDAAYFLKKDPVIGGLEYDLNEGGLIRIPEKIGFGLDIDETYLMDCDHDKILH